MIARILESVAVAALKTVDGVLEAFWPLQEMPNAFTALIDPEDMEPDPRSENPLYAALQDEFARDELWAAIHRREQRPFADTDDFAAPIPYNPALQFPGLPPATPEQIAAGYRRQDITTVDRVLYEHRPYADTSFGKLQSINCFGSEHGDFDHGNYSDWESWREHVAERIVDALK